jgi:hypothetical protein
MLAAWASATSQQQPILVHRIQHLDREHRGLARAIGDLLEQQIAQEFCGRHATVIIACTSFYARVKIAMLVLRATTATRSTWT